MYCVFHHISGHLPRQIWFWKISTKTWASISPPPLVGPKAQVFPKINFDGTPNASGETNMLLVSATGVLLLLLLLQTIGVVWFIWKAKSSRRKAIKKDINPLYGVEYETEDRRTSADQNYDYMGS